MRCTVCLFTFGFNTYVGLGNHDYQNNVGDCAEPSNADYSMNARGEAWFLICTTVLKSIVIMQLQVILDTIVANIQAVRLTLGNMVIFILYNYKIIPLYHVVLDHGRFPQRHVTDSIDWLKRFNSGANSNKTNVLNFHDETNTSQKIISRRADLL